MKFLHVRKKEKSCQTERRTDGSKSKREREKAKKKNKAISTKTINQQHGVKMGELDILCFFCSQKCSFAA